MNTLIDNLHSEIDRIAAFIPSAALRSKHISDWSIGQHIEHVAKATSAFAVTLLRHRSSNLPLDESPLKSVLLERGVFPRGVVEAPEITLPDEKTDQGVLEIYLLKTHNRISKLQDLPPDAAADHHYLGTMQRDEAIAFMGIHLRHHISIIEDILEAA
jgi:hypothetical protein